MKKSFIVRFDQALFSFIHLLLALSLLALPACPSGDADRKPETMTGAGEAGKAFAGLEAAVRRDVPTRSCARLCVPGLPRPAPPSRPPGSPEAQQMTGYASY